MNMYYDIVSMNIFLLFRDIDLRLSINILIVQIFFILL